MSFIDSLIFSIASKRQFALNVYNNNGCMQLVSNSEFVDWKKYCFVEYDRGIIFWIFEPLDLFFFFDQIFLWYHVWARHDVFFLIISSKPLAKVKEKKSKSEKKMYITSKLFAFVEIVSIRKKFLWPNLSDLLSFS